MGLIPRALLYDANGNLIDVADGVAIPAGTGGLLGYGSDAGVARRFLVDASGRQIITGAVGNAAALAGNPVRVAGSDGSLTRDLLTDTLGRQMVVGAAASGAAAAGNPVQVGGIDSGGLLRSILTDNSGVQIVNTFLGAIGQGNVANTLAETRIGWVQTAATTEVAVRATTYTEQATGAQRSINSTSANDASAGTGARTVRITYYVQTGTGALTGPFTETLTLNGVTGVNTVATNIRYIDKIEVLTVGSTGKTVGAIQVWTATGATGAVFASLGALELLSGYAHHYVPTGKTCYVADIVVSTTAGNGNNPNFALRSLDLGIANAAEKLLVDNNRAGGQAASTQTVFPIPPKIVGPARLVAYVTPVNVTSQFNELTLDFYEL